MRDFILGRLRDPLTYVAVTALLGLFGVVLTPEQIAAVQAVLAVFGIPFDPTQLAGATGAASVVAGIALRHLQQAAPK